jgi:transposase
MIFAAIQLFYCYWSLHAMMGPRQGSTICSVYDFSLEDHVPTDHVLRAIEGVIDLSSVRKYLTAFNSSTGRSSVDPELMMRMMLVGCVMCIRSERQLYEENHLNRLLLVLQGGYAGPNSGSLEVP